MCSKKANICASEKRAIKVFERGYGRELFPKSSLPQKTNTVPPSLLSFLTAGHAAHGGAEGLVACAAEFFQKALSRKNKSIFSLLPKERQTKELRAVAGAGAGVRRAGARTVAGRIRVLLFKAVGKLLKERHNLITEENKAHDQGDDHHIGDNAGDEPRLGAGAELTVAGAPHTGKHDGKNPADKGYPYRPGEKQCPDSEDHGREGEPVPGTAPRRLIAVAVTAAGRVRCPAARIPVSVPAAVRIPDGKIVGTVETVIMTATVLPGTAAGVAAIISETAVCAVCAVAALTVAAAIAPGITEAASAGGTPVAPATVFATVTRFAERVIRLAVSRIFGCTHNRFSLK